MESQCLGLAEGLGLSPVVKRVALRSPWRQLTPYLRVFQRHAFAAASDALEPPWPNLLIATGRHSIAASLVVRAYSIAAGTPTLTVQLQNPGISPDHFDLVVTPLHDRVAGANVLATKGALHRISARTLNEGAARWGAAVQHLPRPYISILIGGSNAAFNLTPEWMEIFAAGLARAATQLGGSLLITPSRRTDAAAMKILKEKIGQVPHYLWDGAGENPYFGLLGLADFIVATSDSINMVSEACATGKPVYVAHLPGGTEKFIRFHDALRADGMTREFTDELAVFRYPPLDDMRVVVTRVQAMLEARHGRS